MNVRLSRATGQIKGISAMVSERRYCVDILNQLKAAQAALAGKNADGRTVSEIVKAKLGS